MEAKYKADPSLVIEPKYYNNGVPVFEPTMEEFEDFYKFNKAINKYGMKSGIVKIIPPIEWTNLLKGTYTKENLDRVCIKNPIIQNMNVTAGRKGVYSSQNVEKQRKFNLYQWKELSKKPNYTPPAAKQKTDSSKMDLRVKGRTAQLNATSSILLGSFNIDVSEFTPERCDELSKLYWKSLGYAEPMYGADMAGSLFSEHTKLWNVAHLPNLLDLMDEKLPGVNDAYLYAGLWKASFSWHLEDQDLYSINYLHFGAPKQWYSIPQAQAARFFDLMKDIFSEHYKTCPEFLRHKTFIASPQFLEKNGISCNSVVHNQGEFMITYPYGYHSGFNYGFNLAESVNFALDEWLEIAKKASKCECIGDSVGINHLQIYCKFKGIPYSTLMNISLSTEASTEQDAKAIQSRKLSEEVPRPGRKRQKIKPFVRQCFLCPNNLPPAMTKYKQFQLVNLDTGHNQVHRICALLQQPSLTIVETNGSELAHGLVQALKSRGNKCTFCHIPNVNLPSSLLQGASIGCSMPKCRRHYHATCALSSGFTFDKSLCKMHRAKTAKFLGPSEELYEKCLKIQRDSFVQFSARGGGKRHVGDLFCGVVSENNTDEHTLSVLLYPAMTETLEVHFEDVLMSDVPHLDNSRFISMETSTDLGSPTSDLPEQTSPATSQRTESPEPRYKSDIRNISLDALPVMLPLPGPRFGCNPVFAPPGASFDFEVELCRSRGSNLVFVNEYAEPQHQNLSTPENYKFVDGNFNQFKPGICKNRT